MTLVLAGVLAALVLILFAIHPRRGLYAYLVVVLVAPYAEVGGMAVRVEQVLVPALLLLLATRGRPTLRLGGTAALYLAWWGWLVLATLLPAPSAAVSEVSWITLYTFLRPLGVLVLFSSSGLGEDDVIRLMRWFVAAALPLGLLAVLQALGVGAVTALTLAAYTSPGRTPVADLVAQLGSIVRAVSVFESPTYAAPYFLLAAGIGTRLLLSRSGGEGGRWLMFAGIGAALAGGVATLSATFLAGSLVVALALILSLRPGHRLRWLAVGAVAGLVLAVVVSQSLDQTGAGAGALAYQIERVRTFSVLTSRYGEGGGIVFDALASIRDRPVVGWGLSSPTGVFIGDSLYVLLMYYGGLIGTALFFGLLAMAVYRSRTQPEGRWLFFLWATVMLASGVGSPSLFIPRLQEWWWAMVGLAGWPPLVRWPGAPEQG